MNDERGYGLLTPYSGCYIRIEEYTEGVDYEDFMDDNLVQAGVMRETEIIGEATKRLSQEFRKNIWIYPGERWQG